MPVSGAIRAEIEEQRKSCDLDATQSPVWPDDWSEPEREQMRAIKRAGLVAALSGAPHSTRVLLETCGALRQIAAQAIADAASQGLVSKLVTGGVVIEGGSEPLKVRRIADLLINASVIVEEIAKGSPA